MSPRQWFPPTHCVSLARQTMHKPNTLCLLVRSDNEKFDTMCFSFIFPHGVDDLIRVMLASPTKRLMIISKSSSDVILPRVSKIFTLAPRLAPTVANAYRCLPLAVIARHRLSLLTAACDWLSLLVIACHCVPLLAIGCHCLSLPAFDCRCLPLVVIACHRVPLFTVACR